MPRLEYSNRFANDVAMITSQRVEQLIFEMVDHIERFGEFGSRNVPASIIEEFGEGVRKVAANPFDIVYTLNTEQDIARTEALIPQRTVR